MKYDFTYRTADDIQDSLSVEIDGDRNFRAARREALVGATAPTRSESRLPDGAALWFGLAADGTRAVYAAAQLAQMRRRN